MRLSDSLGYNYVFTEAHFSPQAISKKSLDCGKKKKKNKKKTNKKPSRCT